MTQRELIDYCNTCTCINCRECKHEDICDRYTEKYGNSPFWDDVHYPERYTEEEI